MNAPVSKTPHQIAKIIINAIGDRYREPVKDITGREHAKAFDKATGHICHALRDYMGLTYVSIGKHMNLHSSTVSRARKAHIRRVAAGDFIAIDISQLLPKRGV